MENFKNNKNKLMFLAIWIAVTAGVLHSIYNLESLNDRLGETLASLVKYKGTVFLRPESGLQWQDAKIDQKLIEGDRLATGPASKASIVFTTGHEIEIGPESQIIIESLASNDGQLKINLVKGTIEAKSARTAPGKSNSNSNNSKQLEILSSGETFKLNDKIKALGISKLLGSKPIIFKENNKITNEQIELPSYEKLENNLKRMKLSAKSLEIFDKIDPEDVEEPKEKTKPLPEKQLLYDSGMEPELSDTHTKFWTTRNFSELKNTSIAFPIIKPYQAKMLETTWTPMLIIESPVRDSKKFEILATVPRVQKMQIEFSKIAMLSPNSSSNKVFNILPGAKYEQDGIKTTAIKKKGIKVEISNIEHLRRNNLNKIVFSKFLEKPKEDIWLPEANEKMLKSLNNFLVIKDKRDFGKVANILPILDNFHIPSTPGHQLSESGVFIIKGNTIVAELSKNYSNKQELKRLLNILNADLAYEGGQTDILSETEYSQLKNSKSSSDSTSLNSKSLYFLKGKKYFEINTEFFATQSRLLKFMTDDINTVFRRRVKILAVR